MRALHVTPPIKDIRYTAVVSWIKYRRLIVCSRVNVHNHLLDYDYAKTVLLRNKGFIEHSFILSILNRIKLQSINLIHIH